MPNNTLMVSMVIDRPKYGSGYEMRLIPTARYTKPIVVRHPDLKRVESYLQTLGVDAHEIELCIEWLRTREECYALAFPVTESVLSTLVAKAEDMPSAGSPLRH